MNYGRIYKPRTSGSVHCITACSKVFHPIKLLLIYYKWPGGLGARPVEVFNIKILNRQVKLIGIYLIR